MSWFDPVERGVGGVVISLPATYDRVYSPPRLKVWFTIYVMDAVLRVRASPVPDGTN